MSQLPQSSAPPPGRKARDAREQVSKTPFGSLEDWRIYVIIGVSVTVIGGIVLANVMMSVKGATTVSCVQTMAMFSLGLEEMQGGAGFDMAVEAAGAAEADSALVMRALYNYFTYGPAGFEHDAAGAVIRPLRPLTAAETAGLTPTPGEFFDLKRIPPCPKGGAYRFVRAEQGSALPDIVCPEHGRLARPDATGRYLFDGRLRDLEPRETAMGLVATLALPAQYKPPLDQIQVVAAGAPAPVASPSAESPTP